MSIVKEEIMNLREWGGVGEGKGRDRNDVNTQVWNYFLKILSLNLKKKSQAWWDTPDLNIQEAEAKT